MSLNNSFDNGDAKNIGGIFMIVGDTSTFYWLCKMGECTAIADSVSFVDLLIFASIKFKEQHDESRMIEHIKNKEKTPKI